MCRCGLCAIVCVSVSNSMYATVCVCRCVFVCVIVCGHVYIDVCVLLKFPGIHV